MIFAIVAFATVADYTGLSYINFMIFTGVTAMVICLFYMAIYFTGVTAVRGGVEFIIDVIWSIFWLSAAAALAAKINSYSGTYFAADGNQYALSVPSDWKASDAFAWMSWILWMVSAVLSFRDMRNMGTVVVTGPPATGSSAPTGSVAMV
eukprot:scaffold5.g873.t1